MAEQQVELDPHEGSFAVLWTRMGTAVPIVGARKGDWRWGFDGFVDHLTGNYVPVTAVILADRGGS